MKNFISLLSIALLFFSCKSVYTKKSHQKLPKQVEIAILLPLSGEHQKTGEKLDALINLGLRDGSARNINVTSYDIANEQSVSDVMNKVVSKKTNIILGPISSQDTVQVTNIAKAHNITTISFSNNPTIADRDVYIFGHAPLQQSKKLIKYLSDKRVDNMILLLPDTRQSNGLIQILTDILVQNEITVTKTEKYLLTPEDIDQKVQSISLLIDELNENPENSTKPAVYIADDSDNLALIFNALAKYDIDKKAIICGENKIDIDYKEPFNIRFTGSLNVLNSKLTQELLQNTFASTYLSFWDKMAYDVGLITSYAIGAEEFNKDFFTEKLDNQEGYIGVSGAIRFNNYIAQRKYDIISRQGSNYKTIGRDKLGF
jgi:ABC-type branched-subunit amino acid transport system substrate-binding protein